MSSERNTYGEYSENNFSQKHGPVESDIESTSRMDLSRFITSLYYDVLQEKKEIGSFTQESLLAHVVSHLREFPDRPKSIDQVTPIFIEQLYKRIK